MTDRELMQIIKDQPEQGLKIALQLYGGAVKTICSNIIGRDRNCDVEECISEVFFQLWKYCDGYNPQYSLKNYIYGVARYTALDRREKLQKNIGQVSMELIDLESDLDIPGLMIANENLQSIYRMMGEFSFPDKEIFIYRYYFCFSIQEIADQLDLTYKAVESRLYRGKEKLRQQLAERGLALC